MNQSTPALFRASRIGISGGSVIPKSAADFCFKLGKILGKHKNLILVSGGCKCRKASVEHQADILNNSVDWNVIQGVKTVISDKELLLKIETILPDENNVVIEKFAEGKIIKLYKKSPQARRFEFVSGVDVLVAISGDLGTTQNIDLALALGIPVFPVPIFRGAARDYWNNYKNQVKEWFGINDKLMDKLEKTYINENEKAEEDIIESIANYIIGRLQPSCMVIMPFHENYDNLYENVIKPAILSENFLPIRTDHENATGDIINMIHRGIVNCDCAIAVLTDVRPNVMYELGMAHAFNKPVILLCRKGDKKLPFDIDTHSVIFYSQEDASLGEKIKETMFRVRKTYMPGKYLSFSS